MEQYGATVILLGSAADSVSGGGVNIEHARHRGQELTIATSDFEWLLEMNAAWLVRGAVPILVGQEVADQYDLSRWESSPFSGTEGSVAVLASGTRFDSYVFVDEAVQDTSMLLLLSGDLAAFE